MPKIFFCTKCLNSNLRPRLTFDKHGVCDACQYVKKHNLIDWQIEIVCLKNYVINIDQRWKS